jgi:predicted nucleotidyltransferase
VRTLADIELREADRGAIVAAAEMLRARFPVVAVMLFGSKATGRDDAESDIDLLVLTSRQLHWRERDAVTNALFDIEMDYDVVISTLVVGEQEWLHGPYQVLAIRDEVDRHGVAA